MILLILECSEVWINVVDNNSKIKELFFWFDQILLYSNHIVWKSRKKCHFYQSTKSGLQLICFTVSALESVLKVIVALIKNKTFWDGEFQTICLCLVTKLKLQLVGHWIGKWYGNCWITANLKFSWNLGPGAVCDAVGTSKLENGLVVGRIGISNCVEVFVIVGSHKFMTIDINW